MINLSTVLLSDGGSDNAVLESTFLLVHLSQLLADGNEVLLLNLGCLEVLLLVVMLVTMVHAGLSLEHLVRRGCIGGVGTHVDHGLVKRVVERLLGLVSSGSGE